MKLDRIKLSLVLSINLFWIIGVPVLTNAVIINLRIIEESSNEIIPARVLLRASDGKCYHPSGAVLLKIGPDIWFMSSGSDTLFVPAGSALLRVERGKEYVRVKESFSIGADDSVKKTVVLRRWINMRERGYQCAENHLHCSPDDIAAFCAAEDLDYGTVLQWWNRPRFGAPEGSGHLRNLQFAGVAITTSIYDVEVEEAWGALYLINMPNPFPFLNNTQMPNLPAAQYGREKGTLNCYQSGWSREVLVDAVLGFVDIVNVCNNNFHLHRFQPRSFYSNLLNVADFPIYPDTPEGMMKLNMETYYRLLNCGLKLAAGAGSATGVKEVPVGYNRAYVRTRAKAGHLEFMEGWRAGRNFVTNGPVLFLRTDKGLQPGDSLNLLGNDRKINLEVEALSDSPLSSVEIVVNGEVVKSFHLEKSQNKFNSSLWLNIDTSVWICARCTDTDILLTDDELAVYDGPQTKYTQKPCRLRFAHTSPIYIKMNNRNICVEKSLHEGIMMLDAFEKFASDNAGEDYRTMILQATLQARRVLQEKKKKMTGEE